MELAVSGSLAAEARSTGADAVRFGTLAYRGLAAWDAKGRTLPAHLALRNGTVTLSVDDRDARYPVTIDPFVQAYTKLATFAGSAGTPNSFGVSVATSNDVIVVGAPDSGASNQGAAYIFVKPGGGWAGSPANEDAQLILLGGGSANDHLGYSVAIDGDVVVVGAPSSGGTSTGLAYVFTKAGGGWTGTVVAAAKLDAGGANGDRFGSSVAVTGTTVLVGAEGASGGGAAYIFDGSSGWTPPLVSAMSPSATLTVSGLGAGSHLGNAAAIVGPTAVVAAKDRSSGQGAVYVFDGSSGWATTSTPTATLTTSDAASNDLLTGRPPSRQSEGHLERAQRRRWVTPHRFRRERGKRHGARDPADQAGREGDIGHAHRPQARLCLRRRRHRCQQERQRPAGGKPGDRRHTAGQAVDPVGGRDQSRVGRGGCGEAQEGRRCADSDVHRHPV